LARTTTVAILGTGLIGASIGLALQKRASVLRIIGWDAKRAAGAQAKRRGAIDALAPTLRDAVGSADVVVLAAPHDAVLKLMPAVFRHARRGGLIVDVAGVKRKIVANATKLLKRWPGIAFVGGHPMAGSERPGAKNADAGLFTARPFAICAPPQLHRRSALARAKKFVRALGARPIELEPAAHDRIVAAASALPQLMSVAAASAVERNVGRRATKLAGPALKSAVRLAGSPFHIWEAGLLGNSHNVLSVLLELERRLREMAKAIEHGDRRLLARSFEHAARARRRVLGARERNTGRR